MDYEKKYKDAVKKIRNLFEEGEKNGYTIVTYRKNFEEIFPELKESEDEKIRKEIKIILANTDFSQFALDYTFADMIAWLEKQESVGEIVSRCKNSWYNEGKIAGMAEGLTDDEKYQQGLHDALEKQGEKSSIIVWHGVSEAPEEMEEVLCEWESDDATWHDVVFYHADTKTFWNGERQVIGVTRWCYVDELFKKQGEQKPINMPDINPDDLVLGLTKRGVSLTSDQAAIYRMGVEDTIKKLKGEQKDFRKRYKKIAESEWFKKTYENMSLGNPCSDCIDGDMKETKTEQKSAEWSEEDETGWTNTIIMIKECAAHHYTKDSIKLVVDWLESLKDRVVPQPKQEWSEEDEAYMYYVLVRLKQNIANENFIELNNWLKSLKNRISK